MAYNNGFPVTYPQYYPQMAQMPQPSPAQNNSVASNLIWIQGEAGAKSYLVAPNTTVPLWDSEAQVIYLKSSDASGMPSMKILDYTIREQAASKPKPIENTPEVINPEYVTHKELSEFEEKITHKIDEMVKESTGV